MRIITLLILIFITCNGVSQGARGSVSAQTTATDSGTKRALIVGISDYIEEKLKLNYAENDAALFRDYLSKVEKLTEENITYLADQDAVSPIILKELSAIYKASNEGDWLYFYFAGHGDVVEDFGDKEGFLLAADANANQEYYANGAISLDLLNNKIIGNLVKKGVKVVLVLDACHSGFIFEEGTQRNLGSIQAMFENTTKILSCGPNELSYESGDLQHGYFTYYLVKGLMGTADSNTDNALIFRELDDYLYDNVNATVSKKYNKQQTPVLRTQNDRATFRDINPNETSIAFEAISKSLKTDKGYASRGSLNTSNPEMEHPLVKKFAEAIDKSRLHGSENSAYELYLSAKKEKAVSESILNRMQNALIRDLSTSAQKLINQYIDNTYNLPQGREFQKQARNLEVCLTLLDEEEFLRNKIYTSKLLLEAYADIRNRNYSRYRIAKSKLKEALSIEPRAAYIHNALGMVYNYEEVYDSAHFHFNKAKELIHSWNAPISNLGENLLDQYKYDEAKTLLNTAIGNEGDSFSAHLQLGAVSESEGNYPQAESHYKKALELSPNNALAMQKMAHLQTIRGNSKAAQDLYNKAFEDTNTLKSSNLLHYIQSQNLDNQTAQKLLLEAIDNEPHYSQVYTQYADYLRMNETKLTRLKLADSMYATAIEKDPFNTWAYAGRAWLYLDLKRPTKAVQSLEQGIKNNPNKPEAYFYYANYLKDGENDAQKAETYYLKSIERDAYYIPAYKNLVDLYIGQNQQDKATTLLQNALATNPNAP
ncbi:MAG TPA: caspase family protein, partial [Flavobacteriaceae bacterium]|nr:caspase family protein [Flavobacteriaceae bacterium]